jgi:uncharacterized protein
MPFRINHTFSFGNCAVNLENRQETRALSWRGQVFRAVDDFSCAIGGRAISAYVRAMNMDDKTKTELEAAAFRRLVQHLRARDDVQNIDLMNLAGFCRNCLSNWFEDAARDKGVAVSRDEARTHIYGMPYDEWKATHQSGPAEIIKSPNH